METGASLLFFDRGEECVLTRTLFLSCRVDVRDVAKAHYLALTKPEADGERFIISAGPFCTQGQSSTFFIFDLARRFFFMSLSDLFSLQT